MHDIVTMHHVLAEKILPAHKHFNFVVGKQSSYVATLSAHENLDGHFGVFIFVVATARGRLNCFRRDKSSVYFTQQELGEVRMNRMRPVLAVVSQNPDFSGSLFDFSVDSRPVAERLSVDRPKTAEVIEGPNPMFELAQIFRHRWEWPKMIRDLAVIRAS